MHPLILPNHQLPFTLTVWLSSQLLEVCPYTLESHGFERPSLALAQSTCHRLNQNFRWVSLSLQTDASRFSPTKKHH